MKFIFYDFCNVYKWYLNNKKYIDNYIKIIETNYNILYKILHDNIINQKFLLVILFQLIGSIFKPIKFKMKFHKKQINFPFFLNKLSQLRSLLVCILTCRELSSVDIREAKERGGIYKYWNRPHSSNYYWRNVVESRVVVGVPFEKPMWFRVHLCLGKS